MEYRVFCIHPHWRTPIILEWSKKNIDIPYRIITPSEMAVHQTATVISHPSFWLHNFDLNSVINVWNPKDVLEYDDLDKIPSSNLKQIIDQYNDKIYKHFGFSKRNPILPLIQKQTLDVINVQSIIMKMFDNQCDVIDVAGLCSWLHLGNATFHNGKYTFENFVPPILYFPNNNTIRNIAVPYLFSTDMHFINPNKAMSFKGSITPIIKFNDIKLGDIIPAGGTLSNAITATHANVSPKLSPKYLASSHVCDNAGATLEPNKILDQIGAKDISNYIIYSLKHVPSYDDSMFCMKFTPDDFSWSMDRPLMDSDIRGNMRL